MKLQQRKFHSRTEETAIQNAATCQEEQLHTWLDFFLGCICSPSADGSVLILFLNCICCVIKTTTCATMALHFNEC